MTTNAMNKVPSQDVILGILEAMIDDLRKGTIEVTKFTATTTCELERINYKDIQSYKQYQFTIFPISVKK